MKLCYTPEALHDLSEIKQYINIFFYRIENKNVSAYRIINIRTGQNWFQTDLPRGSEILRRDLGLVIENALDDFCEAGL